ADTRDGMFQERLNAALTSCHDCRTEANCTEVCPKGISPTRAIKYIQRVSLTQLAKPVAARPASPTPPAEESKIDRASFLRQAGVVVLGAGVAIALGGIATVTAVGPSKTESKSNWIPLARLSDLPPGHITTLLMKYQIKSGIYTQEASAPVLISRLSNEITCYKTACPHLGCTVRWDVRSDQFRCACHGGTFDRAGNVIAGPPPRGLDRYESKVE